MEYSVYIPKINFNDQRKFLIQLKIGIKLTHFLNEYNFKIETDFTTVFSQSFDKSSNDTLVDEHNLDVAEIF